MTTWRHRIRLEPSTQEDIDYVEDNFREGERREADAAGGRRTRLDEFEQCWTAKAENGDIVGYFGVMTMPDDSFMSRTRALCFMSCENANRHKLAFVASSMPALREVAAKCPSWVDTFRSWPLESYKASIRWQEKVLGFRRVGRVRIGDDAYIHLETTRKEIFG